MKKLTSMINTPSDALDTLKDFISTYKNKNINIAEQFDEDFSIAKLTKDTRYTTAMLDLDNTNSWYGQLDTIRTKHTGVWRGLELAFTANVDDLSDFDEPEYDLSIRLDDPCQVSAAVSRSRLSTVLNTLINTVWINTGCNLNDENMTTELANDLLKDIEDLRHRPKWFETDEEPL